MMVLVLLVLVNALTAGDGMGRMLPILILDEEDFLIPENGNGFGCSLDRCGSGDGCGDGDGPGYGSGYGDGAADGSITETGGGSGTGMEVCGMLCYEDDDDY